MRKMKNSKGFTLMEMLIVVAIIAVLVAIAIPTFNASLNKAKVATDEANIRSGYASFMAMILTKEDFDTSKTYYLQKDGGVETTNTAAYECVGNQTTAREIAGRTVGTWSAGDKVTYKVTSVATGENDKVNVTIAIEQQNQTGTP